MSKENVLTVVVALIVGLLGGYLIFNIAGNKELPANVSVPQGAGSPTDYQRRITEAEKIVARDPKNAQVWTQLGNDYFDTHQQQKAIDAYAKALALQPDDPDVLTDQGVMYRQLGQFEKAIANFHKANQLNPSHVQSVFNEGIVYSQDLKNPAKAREAFNKVVQLAPGSPQAAQATQLLAGLEAAPARR